MFSGGAVYSKKADGEAQGWLEQGDNQHCVGSQHRSSLCVVVLIIDESKCKFQGE